MSNGRLHGKVAKYKGKWVYCYKHVFMGDFNRISNSVYFYHLKPNGTMGKKAGDYDNGPFKQARIPEEVVLRHGKPYRVKYW